MSWCPVNAATCSGVSPSSLLTFTSSTEGHREVALLLIQNGAEVNVKREDGDTPS